MSYTILRRYLGIFFMLFCLKVDAQDSAQQAYREDQFYFGISFINLTSDNALFKQNRLSGGFGFGFVRDMPITPSRKWALGIGLGYERQWYNTNLLRTTISKSQPIYTFQGDNLSNNTSLFSLHSLAIPLELRWRNSDASKYKFWRIYTGLRFHWNLRSVFKAKGEGFVLDDEINPWTTVGYLSIGFNTWNLYFGYEFQSILNKDFPMADDITAPLNMKGIKFGLMFYLL